MIWHRASHTESFPVSKNHVRIATCGDETSSKGLEGKGVGYFVNPTKSKEDEGDSDSSNSHGFSIKYKEIVVLI